MQCYDPSIVSFSAVGTVSALQHKSGYIEYESNCGKEHAIRNALHSCSSGVALPNDSTGRRPDESRHISRKIRLAKLLPLTNVPNTTFSRAMKSSCYHGHIHLGRSFGAIYMEILA